MSHEILMVRLILRQCRYMDFSLDDQIKLMNTMQLKIIVWSQAGYDIPKVVPSCKQI